MLDGLKVLGKAHLEFLKRQFDPREALLRSLVQVDILSSPKNTQNPQKEKSYLVFWNLRKDDQGLWHLELDDPQELGVELLYQSLWIGHARAAEIQNRATVANATGLGYMLSQLLPALAGWIGPGLDENESLRGSVREFCEEFCLPLPKASKQSNYKWIWNLPVLNSMFQQIFPEIFENMSQYDSKAFVGRIAKRLDGYVRNQWDLSSEVTLLYTLRFNGEWLPRLSAYQKYLYWYVMERLFSKNKARRGTCYLCGQHNLLTDDTTRLRFKFYITDKPGFASGFRKANFYRNYALCKACYQEILAGEAFLRTRLRSWLGAEVYVLPVFYLEDVQPSGANLEHWAGYVVRRWEASRTWEGWKNFRARLDEYREFEHQKAWFLLDFLFVEDDGRSIKLQQYIQDVPPSRLDRLDEARYQTSAFANDYFVDSRSWDLSLSTLYYLFPIGKKGQGKQAFFQFLSALLHERPVDFRILIPLFLETASVYRFQKYGAYIQRPPQGDDPQRHEKALCYFLAQTQLVRYDLFHLGLFSPLGGMPMSEMMFADEVRRLVPPKVWDYMDALGLDVPQRALFLLGYLVGEVALAQQKTGSVPILNKIHFQGMDEGKVRRLSNEILDQMRIYRVLYPDTRDLFAAMRALMDQAQRLLSPAENTYWVLSGYAFRYLRRFGASAPSKIEQETDQ